MNTNRNKWLKTRKSYKTILYVDIANHRKVASVTASIIAKVTIHVLLCTCYIASNLIESCMLLIQCIL